ncbi:MAG TPA: TIGR04053 family radical SAM/SPASM domain-containing protein [Streptosporangiaceae bacterium]|nr:TIGR04053 family radical SAM/SPASM domain-containing protein [Streptosporangiaceae bacterium]
MTATSVERPPARAVRTPHYDLTARPFLVIWECTRACQLACRHCRAEAQLTRNPGELSTAEAANLAGQIAAFGQPRPLFIITGGDPFSRGDLAEIVRAAVAAGLPVAVSPSGTPSLTRENLARIQDAGATAISLSLDGPTASMHDGFRGVSGVYDWTLRGWEAARSLGLKVQVNTTVSRHNLTSLPDIVRLVAERGAMTWSAFLLVPTGRGRDLESLAPAEVEDVLNFVYDAGRYVAAKTTEGHHFRRVAIQRAILADEGADHVRALGLGPLYRELVAGLEPLAATGIQRPRRRTPMDVNAGRGFVFVSHVGTVHPSGFLPADVGNVRDRPLTEIYRDAELMRGLRDPDRLAGRCGQCEFRTACGGSRSRAYALTGDPYAEEPWCGYQPGSFGRSAEIASRLART